LGLPITSIPTAPALLPGRPPVEQPLTAPAPVAAGDLLARAMAILAEETAAWQARQRIPARTGGRA
jgi:hypothetical protein